LSHVFWAALLTMFTPGAPGNTSSVLMGTHYTNETACVASVLKDQPAGAIRTSDGRWIVESCVRVDPQAYIMTDDGQHVTFKPGTNVRAMRKALCAAARKARDVENERKCASAGY
jgi:hypothetical protein